LAPEKGKKEVPLLCPKRRELIAFAAALQCRPPRRVGVGRGRVGVEQYVAVAGFRAWKWNQHLLVIS
jgi:hypothetical protein